MSIRLVDLDKMIVWRRDVARVALDVSRPILSDYVKYIKKDRALPAKSKRIRMEAVSAMRDYLKEASR